MDENIGSKIKIEDHSSDNSIKLLIIVLSLISLLSIVAAIYFVYQNRQSNKQITQLELKPSPQSTGGQQITRNPDRALTSTENSESTAVSKKADDTTPTKTVYEKINYNLPNNWESIKDSNNQFQIGYNPEEFSARSYPGRIGLNHQQWSTFNFVIRIEENNGKTKKSLLNKYFQGYEIAPKTYERNYLVGGKPALVIYNVEYSSTIIIGVITLNEDKALVFSSTGGNEEIIKQLLATIKTN